MSPVKTATTTTTETVDKGVAVTSQPALPPVGELFSKAWDVFKLSWHKQLALSIATTFLVVLITIVAILVFAVLNLPQIPHIADLVHTGTTGLSVIPQSVWLEAYVIIAIWGVVIWLMTTALTIATLVVVNSSYKSEEISLKAAFVMGLKKSVPMFALNLVLFFFVMGGYWLLLLPGIVMGIYFSFSTYELVLENKSIVASMRESLRLVSAHFWAFLGRIGLLVVVMYGIEIVLAITANNLEKAGVPTGIFSIVNLLFQTASNFYAIAYVISLYHFMKDASVNAKPGKLRTFIIISVIGWIFGVLSIAAIASFSIHQLPALLQTIQKEQQLYASPEPTTRPGGITLPEVSPTDTFPMYPVPSNLPNVKY